MAIRLDRARMQPKRRPVRVSRQFFLPIAISAALLLLAIAPLDQLTSGFVDNRSVGGVTSHRLLRDVGDVERSYAIGQDIAGCVRVADRRIYPIHRPGCFIDDTLSSRDSED